MGKDITDINLINVAKPIENVYWLNPSMVDMTTYILDTCSIHSQ